MIHANRYDTLEVWCDARSSATDVSIIGGQGPPHELDEVTCPKCLDAIVKYGALARARRLELSAAPYNDVLRRFADGGHVALYLADGTEIDRQPIGPDLTNRLQVTRTGPAGDVVWFDKNGIEFWRKSPPYPFLGGESSSFTLGCDFDASIWVLAVSDI